MQKQYELFDDDTGDKVIGVYIDMGIKDYPCLIKLPPDIEEAYLSSAEMFDLYLILEEIFGKESIENE